MHVPCRPEHVQAADANEFVFPCRPRHSRGWCTDASAKKCLVMDADDEAVLNLIAECEWDLSNPPGSTSSSQKEHEADLHRPQGVLLSVVKAQCAAGTGFTTHSCVVCSTD